MELISAATREPEAMELALRSAIELVDAEFGAVLRAGKIAATVGMDMDADADARHLQGAAQGRLSRSELPGVGRVDLASVALDEAGTSWLIVGRRLREPFSPAQDALLEAIARVLALNIRVVRATQEERGLRRLGELEMRQRKLVERELARQALHDRLTGLPNRSLLRERAGHALARARHGFGYVAALFVDLDNFKLANDSLDHRRGDRLLVLVAQRLDAILALDQNQARNCTLGRPGGDELIVLCEDLPTERDAISVAEQIHESLRAPFVIDGHSVLLTTSIGIAIADGGEEDEIDADALLRDADVALSRAKERGRDRYEIFDENMRVRMLDRVALEGELRAGLGRSELVLLYQPVVTVSDGSLAAVEALVRWQHPERGLLSPAEFIPVAEESELIVAIGAWVIDQACAQIRRWHESHHEDLGVRVSVNVSARQLSPALVDSVAASLARHGVRPSQIALEITESLLIEHTESSLEVLAALEKQGISIVLDDFGTGYSSLGYLKEFPLAQLKLDRAFTSELARDPRSAKIIAATIDMARALGMTVVAEGVETAEQLEVLQRLGCDYAQGYLFAQPETGEAIFDRIRAAYERDREIAGRTPVGTRFAAAAGAGAAAAAAILSREPIDPHRRQQVAIGRLAGWLFLVGSILAIPSDLVMGSPSPRTVVALTLMGLVSSMFCFAVPWHRVSARWLNFLAVLATVEITISVIADGAHGMVLLPIYLLIATATAYAFRDRRVIALHVALIAAAMCVPLLVGSHHPATMVPLTLVSVFVLVMMSAVIAYLRELLEGSTAELRELAGRDPLTEVGNYRLLHERFAHELVRHDRESAPLAVLLIDLDRFKQVNERRGHAAGDDVLRRVGQTLRDAVRQSDTVARQGGDEFAILASHTDADGAAMLAARVRERLGRIQFAGDCIGATIGWAVYPADGATATELLARADEQMMTAKLSPGQPGAQSAVARAGTLGLVS
jgi:diguanylate cyclase (GGDEF)-like protein